MSMRRNERSTPVVESSNSNGNGNCEADADAVELLEGNIVREDVLQCLSKNGEFCKLVLTESGILVQSTKKNVALERYSINDLFGCHVLRSKKSATKGSAFLCFYLYPRCKKGSHSGTKCRAKVSLLFEIANSKFEDNLDCALKWKNDALHILEQRFPKRRMRNETNNIVSRSTNNNNGVPRIEVMHDDEENVEIFYDVENRDDGNIQNDDSPHDFDSFLPFIRKYIVILNPKSGQGKSITIFHDKVSPILTEANIKVDLLVTERPGHARLMISGADLSEIDGIVTVGGDGLLFEVVNGLRSRADADTIANIPVGVIAGGSGNGLARSIAHYSGESPDYLRNPVLSTSLAAARGNIMEVNLMEVELDGSRIYSFLSTGWGLLSDIDVESEVLRRFGETRFALWSFLCLATLRSYRGKLTFIPWDVSNSPESANRKLGLENGREQIVEGDFVNIYSTCQSHIGTDLVFAPDATSNDRVIHLTYIERSAGRGTATQFLFALGKGDHINVSGVKYATVKEFTLKGEGVLPGNLTIDGERVTGETIKVRLAPKPLLMFSL